MSSNDESFYLLKINIIIIATAFDVQSVEAVFFENCLYLHCSFVNGSRACGCIVQLTSSSSNTTESFEISRESGFLCTNSRNQQDVYNSVVVTDRGQNGMQGNVTMDITQTVVNATNLEQYIELTGCHEGKIVRSTEAEIGQ